MNDEAVYLIDKDIEMLKMRIIELEMNMDKRRIIEVQLAIDCNWTDDIIKRTIGSSDEELKFFRGK